MTYLSSNGPQERAQRHRLLIRSLDRHDMTKMRRNLISSDGEASSTTQDNISEKKNSQGGKAKKNEDKLLCCNGIDSMRASITNSQIPQQFLPKERYLSFKPPLKVLVASP